MHASPSLAVSCAIILLAAIGCTAPDNRLFREVSAFDEDPPENQLRPEDIETDPLSIEKDEAARSLWAMDSFSTPSPMKPATVSAIRGIRDRFGLRAPARVRFDTGTEFDTGGGMRKMTPAERADSEANPLSAEARIITTAGNEVKLRCDLSANGATIVEVESNVPIAQRDSLFRLIRETMDVGKESHH